MLHRRKYMSVRSPVRLLALLLSVSLPAISLVRASGAPAITLRSLADQRWAVYNMPHFSLEFATRAPIEVDTEDDVLEEVAFPLATTTEQALLSYLQLEWSTEKEERQREQHPMLAQLVTVEVQYELEWAADAAKTTDLEETTTIRAQVLSAELAFREPSTSSKLSNAQMDQLLRPLLRTFFAQNSSTMKDLIHRLTQTSNPILQQVTQVDGQVTDADQVPADYAGPSTSSSSNRKWSSTTSWLVALTLIVVLALAFVMYQYVSPSSRRMWHCCWRIKYSRSPKLDYGEEDEEDGLEGYRDDPGQDSYYHDDHDEESPYNPGPLPNVSRPSLARAGSLDAVRHGSFRNLASSNQAARNVLEKSDRYLSKHRPDLLDGSPPSGNTTRRGSTLATPFGYYHGSAGGVEGDSSNTGTYAYNVPSNPFQFLYDAASKPWSFQQQQQSPQEGMAQRRSSLMEIEASNLAAQPETIYTAPLSTRSISSHNNNNNNRGMDSIWRRVIGVASSLSSVTRFEEDGREDNVDAPDDETPTTKSLSQTELLRRLEEEDDNNASYEFAFADFPRKDGTPCLIYDPNAIFRIGSLEEEESQAARSQEAALQRSEENDAFRSMLSQHSAVVPSFDEDDDTYNNDSDDDEKKVEDPSPKKERVEETLDDGRKNAAFQAKLGRLMVSRHRQYEKRSIVEKHQKSRTSRRLKRQQRQQEQMNDALERLEADVAAPLESSQFMKQDDPSHRRVASNASTTARELMSPAVSAPLTPKRRGQSPMRGHPLTPKRSDNGQHGSDLISAYSPRRRDPTRGSGLDTAYSPRRGRGLTGRHSTNSPMLSKRSPRPNHNHNLTSSPMPHRPTYPGTLRQSPVPMHSQLGSQSLQTALRPTPRTTASAELALEIPRLVNGAGSPSEEHKKKSPQSVMDEIMTPPSQKGAAHARHPSSSTLDLAKSSNHRRGYSFDVPERLSNSILGGSFSSNVETISGNVPRNGGMYAQQQHHQRGNSFGKVAPRSRSHSRSRREAGMPPTARVRSISRSRRRPETPTRGRQTSQNDDVLVHGVYAQTRMI